jgi:hypothetical protein
MSFVSLSYELTHELRFELTQMPRYGWSWEVAEFVPLPWVEALLQDVSVASWRLILIAEELGTFFDIKSASN